MENKTPAEVVIKRFGVRPLARQLGINPSAVIRWRKKGFVPCKYHVRIIELSQDKLTADDLVFGRVGN